MTNSPVRGQKRVAARSKIPTFPLMVPFDLQQQITTKLVEIGRKLAWPNDFDPLVHLADPRFGDFQANGILALGKRQKFNPRQLAEQALELLIADRDWENQWETTLAGGGFLNFRLRPTALRQWINRYSPGRDRPQTLANRRILIDYSCPNTAKQMHVGHLRSLVIGDALKRMIRALGATVIGDNHLGDWGTAFGILLRQLRKEAIDWGKMSPEKALEALESLYRRGQMETQTSPEALAEARQLLRQLQQGNPEATAQWEAINRISYAAFQEIYDITNVQFDLVLGESFYRNQVDRVYRELLETGIAKEDQGALVVFHPEHSRFKSQPFLIRKSDLASNYASTDLAAILYRSEVLGVDEILYVTDARQKDHFEQLFLTAEKWFHAKGYRLPRLVHITFGTVCGEDGKAIKTRSGEPIHLKNLLHEACARAATLLAGKNPELADEEREKISQAVGIGAVKYFDLLQNRSSDYVFSWDRMLSFDGNTAPYLQYAATRILSIFRRFQPEARATDLPRFSSSDEPFETPEEQLLARKLTFFYEAIKLALKDFRPSSLCSYLYELAGLFSSFYNSNRILGEESPRKERRLLLCERTLSVLQCGLGLLGIDTLEKM